MRAKLETHVRAGFSGLWVQSHEHDEALREIAEMCREREWNMMVWDCDAGLSVNGSAADGNTDAVSVVRSLAGAGDNSNYTLLVLCNPHHFLGDPMLIQAVQRQIVLGKSEPRRTIIALSSMVNIPPELTKLFVVIEHELPTRDELSVLATSIAQDDEYTADELPAIVDAATGLTRYEAENAFALSIVEHGRLCPSSVWGIKSQAVSKSGTMAIYRGGERFSDLCGMDAVKRFCKQSMTVRHDKAKPKGVLLLGVPGAGKSAFSKALGNETGRPTITLDFGALMGSLVGQSEQRTRDALRIIDAMAPCVLFVDEIEKGLAGAGGENDSGVSSRMLGTLLTWLNDHTSDVFFIGTCNDISKLASISAGAFTRAERFDGVFFIDMPDKVQRDCIWDMYTSYFGVSGEHSGIDDNGWTGAEIKACCRLSAMLNVPLIEAAQNVIPVSRSAGSKIAALREWADGNAIDANVGGVYSRRDVASVANASLVRKISRN